MSDLSIRQDKFAREYVKTGNGTQAAIKAGYAQPSAHVQGSRLISNAKVSKEIAAHRRRMQERLDISRETLINNAAHIAEQASVDQQYGPAIKATELILKAQGYLVERSLNLNADVTQQHLDALMQYTEQRIGEAKQEIREEIRHGDSGNRGASITDVCTDNADHSMDVMTNAAHVDATDNADAANPLKDNDIQPDSTGE
jgi:phage terminase small subunit